MGILVFALLVAVILYVMYLVGKGVSKGAELFIVILPISLLFAWFTTILPGLLNIVGNLLFLYVGMKIFKYVFGIKDSGVNFILYTITCIFIWNVPSTLYPFLWLVVLMLPYRFIKNIRNKRKSKLNKTEACTTNTTNENKVNQIKEKEEKLIENNINEESTQENRIIDVEYYNV